MVEQVGSSNNEQFPRLSPQNEELKHKLLDLFRSLPKEKKRDFWNELNIYGQRLREKYAECERYEVFHVIASSTLKKRVAADYYRKEDFPGEDSAFKFLEDLINKYQS